MGQKNITRHRIPELKRGTEAKNLGHYVLKKGLKEPAKCTMCQSVYHHKRWYLKDEPIAVELKDGPMELTVCPACRKIQDHFPEGVVALRGEFLTSHKDQILHLIRNEEIRAKGVNPLERIISIKEMEDFIEIQMTSERLAQRIGKDIKRAFKGEVSYHWSKDDKLLRVEWRREGDKEIGV